MILIAFRLKLKSWNEIKSTLSLYFGEQRNIECLMQDLLNLRPNKNESPYNFGRRLITSKFNSLLTYAPEEKKILIKNYNDLALKSYIRGLQKYLKTQLV